VFEDLVGDDDVEPAGGKGVAAGLDQAQPVPVVALAFQVCLALDQVGVVNVDAVGVPALVAQPGDSVAAAAADIEDPEPAAVRTGARRDLRQETLDVAVGRVRCADRLEFGVPLPVGEAGDRRSRGTSDCHQSETRSREPPKPGSTGDSLIR
jgi:hypothetical protein